MIDAANNKVHTIIIKLWRKPERRALYRSNIMSKQERHALLFFFFHMLHSALFMNKVSRYPIGTYPIGNVSASRYFLQCGYDGDIGFALRTVL